MTTYHPPNPDYRHHSDPTRRRWVPDTVTANQMPEPVTEPDPERRMRALVAVFVNGLVSDFIYGHTSHANANEFHAGVRESVRGYAAEMDLDIEAAAEEARRLLEVLL